MSLLEIDNLATHFFTDAGVVKAIDGVSFAVDRGEVLAVVGESGSGKSVTGLSVMGLIGAPGRIVGGTIRFDGTQIANAPANQMRALRGARIAMIFQDPMMTLNPVLRIDTQMLETINAHRRMPHDAAWTLCRDALGRVGIPSPDERMRAYPHQFSGGMRQRVAIAIALLNDPDLIIADEPTTALDVTIQAQVLHLMQGLVEDRGMGLMWVTHDLSVVAGFADRVAVMYAGEVVEDGRVDDIITAPRHPYTRGLIGSVPSRNQRGVRLAQIPGAAPQPLNRPKGCRFAPRCAYRAEGCEVPQALRDGVRCWRTDALPCADQEVLA
ncbi:ABC transporter ATP-binding protein [Roseicitreum antarcticum]|uniref:Peptide/nickel transport system ATP-binding protein n=1 Tax=Roseicitreum antarcticum TaxID=564137 RepID=A0A1H2VRA1_9RHOB|nr:ABC transporter ATP-binding protein [Roseicitreum antarcticum]SDW70798.1 peptide/nickel transport system ATP-binding protein [Roseicitreum antarcticum]